jgi:hypothetical protein
VAKKFLAVEKVCCLFVYNGGRGFCERRIDSGSDGEWAELVWGGGTGNDWRVYGLGICNELAIGLDGGERLGIAHYP